jgi:hypothetical protein
VAFQVFQKIWVAFESFQYSWVAVQSFAVKILSLGKTNHLVESGGIDGSKLYHF